MSILKTNAFQSVAGVTYQVPVSFERITTTSYVASSSTSVWNTYWTFYYTPRGIGNRLFVWGQVNLLSETSGKTQNLRLTANDVEVYRQNSIQECAFAGWYAQGCPIFAELPTVSSTSLLTFRLQIYHNSGTAYINYPYTGLGNPLSELIFMEVKQ